MLVSTLVLTGVDEKQKLYVPESISTFTGSRGGWWLFALQYEARCYETGASMTEVCARGEAAKQPKSKD